MEKDVLDLITNTKKENFLNIADDRNHLIAAKINLEVKINSWERELERYFSSKGYESNLSPNFNLKKENMSMREKNTKDIKIEYVSFNSSISNFSKKDFEPPVNTDLNTDELIHDLEGKLAMIKVENCIEMEKCDNIESEIEVNLLSIKVLIRYFY